MIYSIFSSDGEGYLSHLETEASSLNQAQENYENDQVELIRHYPDTVGDLFWIEDELGRKVL